VKLRWNLEKGCRQMKVAKDDDGDILLFVVLNILVLLSKG